jgi:putative tryptophan/tyrosine transport system substrate-binding protein
VQRTLPGGPSLTHQRHWLCTAAMVLLPGLSKCSFEPIQCWALRLGADMRRREFISLLGGAAAVAWPLAARAQQPGKLPRIGVLVSASPPHPFADAFRRGLRSFGYTEGKNITIEFLYTGARGDRAMEFAAELVRSGVDIIVAHFTPAARAAIAATRTIPIVMAPAGAPLQQGLIDSLARPSGNVTGLSSMDAEIGGKRLQLLRELMPNLVCVAVLAATPATDGGYGKIFVEDLHMAATKAGLELVPALVDGPNEFERAFEAMSEARAQAVIIQGLFEPQGSMTFIELANKHRLALMSGVRETVAAGGLVSMSSNYLQLYERAAFYVDNILRGAKPADLPVEQPTNFQTVLNMKTAQALGLTISPTLLAQTDEVFE